MSTKKSIDIMAIFVRGVNRKCQGLSRRTRETTRERSLHCPAVVHDLSIDQRSREVDGERDKIS